MGFSHLRIGQKAPHLFRRAQTTACSNGGFTNPTFGQSVDSLKPLNISWDTTCLLNVQSIDIVLSSPGSAQPLLQGWQSVNFASGYRVIELLPRKWNDSASQQLQLSLYQSGTPSFMSPLPAGPVFTATYIAPSGSVPAAADMGLENGSSSSAAQKSSSHGKTAAAVLVPLLLIIASIITYVRIQRRRGREKRKRWSEMVDKRMSTISTDWKSMSVAGAQAAIRQSIAINACDSPFSFGAIRPSSIAAIEPTSPDMAQIRRPGTGLRSATLANSLDSPERVSRVSFADTVRVSRVSFAADPRPSSDFRRTVGSSRASRAFHSAYAPPVPSLPQVHSPKEKVKDNDEVDVNMSPRQAAGPITLSPEDIRARIQSAKVEESNDDILPALAVMRTGSRTSTNIQSCPTTFAQIEEEGNGDDYLLPPSVSRRLPEFTHLVDTDLSILPSFPMPFPPPATSARPSANSNPPRNPIKPSPLTLPAPPTPTPPTTPPITPPTIPAPILSTSPDAMLRAYAERQGANKSPGPTRSINNSPFRTSLSRHNSLGTTGGSLPDEMLRAYSEKRTTPPFVAMPTVGEGGTPDDMLRAYAERRAAQAASNTNSGSSGGGRFEKRPSLTFGSPGGRLEKRPSFTFGLVGKKGKKKDRDSRLSATTPAPATVTASKTIPAMSINYTVTTETETETEGNLGAVDEIGNQVSAGSLGMGAYGGARHAIGEAGDDLEHASGGTA